MTYMTLSGIYDFGSLFICLFSICMSLGARFLFCLLFILQLGSFRTVSFRWSLYNSSSFLRPVLQRDFVLWLALSPKCIFFRGKVFNLNEDYFYAWLYFSWMKQTMVTSLSELVSRMCRNFLFFLLGVLLFLCWVYGLSLVLVLHIWLLQTHLLTGTLIWIPFDALSKISWLFSCEYLEQ